MNRSLLKAVALVVMISGVACAHTESGDGGEFADLELRLTKQPQNVKLMIELAAAYQTRGIAGDKDAVKRADELAGRALELAPENPEILCLHGGILALKGRDAALPFEKMRLVQKGLGKMDRAVSLAPHSVTVRMTRGGYCLNLPDIFVRVDTALVDYHHLLAMAAAQPDALGAELQAEIELRLGQAYAKKGEYARASEHLSAAVALAPASKIAAEAQALLAKLAPATERTHG